MKFFVDENGRWHPLPEDPEEIVLCKDCRMGEEDTDFYGKPCIRCHNSANGVGHVLHDPEWYCADGKVKK